MDPTTLERPSLSWGLDVNERLMLPQFEASNAAELLARMAARLHALGYVDEGFVNALLDRERDYPTGLATEPVPVAIPHAYPGFVVKPAVAVAVLKQPVDFQAMGDPERTLAVRAVFLIAINEPTAQLDFLRRFALAIQNDTFLPGLLAAQNARQVRDLVMRSLIEAESPELQGDK